MCLVYSLGNSACAYDCCADKTNKIKVDLRVSTVKVRGKIGERGLFLPAVYRYTENDWPVAEIPDQ